MAQTHSQTDLFEQYRLTHDIEIRNDIILRYMDLVKYIAFSSRGLYSRYAEVDDIVNEGVLALMRAIESYDPHIGVVFESFASIRIKGAIIDFIRKQDWVPRSVRHFGHELDLAYSALYAKLNRTPTNQELAEHMGVSKEKFLKVLTDLTGVITLSFEELIFEDNFENCESATASADHALYEKELREVIASAIDELKPKEKQVVSLYYYENLKFSEIGKVLSVSESRVCQIHSKAMLLLKRKLREYMDKD